METHKHWKTSQFWIHFFDALMFFLFVFFRRIHIEVYLKSVMATFLFMHLQVSGCDIQGYMTCWLHVNLAYYIWTDRWTQYFLKQLKRNIQIPKQVMKLYNFLSTLTETQLLWSWDELATPSITLPSPCDTWERLTDSHNPECMNKREQKMDATTGICSNARKKKKTQWSSGCSITLHGFYLSNVSHTDRPANDDCALMNSGIAMHFLTHHRLQALNQIESC